MGKFGLMILEKMMQEHGMITERSENDINFFSLFPLFLTTLTFILSPP